ncbi:MAG: MFS transporter [Chloroflexi bacterium]|jgi:EmrB/QacA subfamily drug resistance transporter|nr:MFS transporter [Chloroflexota bacterium]
MEATPVPETGTPGGYSGHGWRPAIEVSHRARLEILGAILLALLLGALDQTIVGTALPTIVTDLEGNDLYTWVVTIYLLTSTISVPFYGKLSDLYGRKPLLIIGIVIFLVGSALSGLSQTMEQLILFRGIQGLGAGALFPISLAVIGDLFSPQERGKYQGLFGAVFGVSALVGPALGGFITDTWSWHWIFYVNIPLGAISLYFIVRLLPTVKRADATRTFDLLGAAVFVVAMVPFLVGLTNKQTGDWTDPTVGGFIVFGVAAFIVFLAIEWRAREPIVPLDLWRGRTYAGSIVATFFSAFGFFAATVFLPRLYQVVFGESATMSGYELFPLLLGVIGSSIISGQVVSRTGRYKLLMVGSTALIVAGSWLFTNLTSTTDPWVIRGWMFILGVGIGPTLAVFTIIVQNAVPFAKLGVATSNLTFFRQIGGVVGLSIAGTVFGTVLRDQIPVQLVAAGVPQQVVDGVQGGSFDPNTLVGVGGDLGQTILANVPEQLRPVLEPLVPNIVSGIYAAIGIAIANVFWLGVLGGAVAFVAVLVIRELPLRTAQRLPVRTKDTAGVAEGGVVDVPAEPA